MHWLSRPSTRWTLLCAVLLALIVIPFVLWEAPLDLASQHWLEQARAPAWLFGVVVLLLVADVVLPVPSSFVASWSVALLGATWGALAIVLGMSLSAALGYLLGGVFGKPLALRLVGEQQLERAHVLMQRYGAWLVLICRGAPVLAEASTLLAGLSRMPRARFALVSVLGNAGLALAYAAIARFALHGLAAWLAPFILGLLVPALAWGAVLLLAGGKRD